MKTMCLSMDEWIKIWYICIYNRILFSHYIEWNSAIYNNMDEPWMHYAKWIKPDRDKCCMVSLVCGILKTCQTQKSRE